MRRCWDSNHLTKDLTIATDVHWALRGKAEIIWLLGMGIEMDRSKHFVGKFVLPL
jgi:hypothetical protein